ncbi:exosortase H-associated membrane protein [Thiofilum flexile]|uniref:exosortase H-associated membrane protein n=1 Tax=Thiofilum flexile TaxID=125627 RepID=UPI00036EB4ED|nr:exosortase H-associated membrane protein [Thiofilum flexile]
MNMNTSLLSTFVLRVLLYLAPLFAVWYILAPWHLMPVVTLTNSIIQAGLADFIMWVKLQGSQVVVATHYGFNTQGVLVTPPPLQEAAGFTLNPLSFGYGLPLFAALILATPLTSKGTRLLMGELILLGLQVVSLVVCIIKSLTFEVDPLLQQTLQWSPLQLDLIALGYQVGFLLLPMIAPIIVWAILSQPFLNQLAPSLHFDTQPS